MLMNFGDPHCNQSLTEATAAMISAPRTESEGCIELRGV